MQSLYNFYLIFNYILENYQELRSLKECELLYLMGTQF